MNVVDYCFQINIIDYGLIDFFWSSRVEWINFEIFYLDNFIKILISNKISVQITKRGFDCFN